MKSRWCQRASLRRRRFRGSNSVPFSDLFWVRIVLAVSATTASLIGPALVHQCRAAWTVRRWLRGTTRCDRGTPSSAHGLPPLGPAWASASTPGEARARGLQEIGRAHV